MCKPNESRRRLLSRIHRSKTLTFSELHDMAKDPELDFGPGVDAADVIVAEERAGRLTIDSRAQQIAVRSTD